MWELSECSTGDIYEALENNCRLIAEKPSRTSTTPGFWKAVESRRKLRRELVIRGEVETAPVPLPADRLPFLTIEAADAS